MTTRSSALERVRTGLTFDDVLLVPRRSRIRSRQDVSLRTRLTRTIEIDLPVLAANMDTVCEQEMAAAMGRLGGVGVIHRFLPITVQADMVAAVKEEDASIVTAAAVGTDHDAVGLVERPARGRQRRVE